MTTLQAKSGTNKAVARMLRDQPSFASFPMHVLEVLAWAYRYTETPIPTRNKVMRVMTALATLARRIED